MTSQKIFDGYAELLKDMRARISKKEELVDFFKSEEGKEFLGLNNLTTVLSVGVGFGNIDAVLITQCPKVKEYVALEPVIGFHDDLKNNIGCFPSIKTEIIENTFETYPGKDDYFDGVFFISSAQYFSEVQLRRALGMVKSGGKMIIIITHCGPYLEASGKQTGKDFNNYMKLKTIIGRIDPGYSETKVKTYYDFSDPGPMNQSIIDISFGRMATTEEKNIVMQEISHHYIPGTKSIEAQEYIFAISKT